MSKPRIALINIHGVSNQKPGQTVAQLARVLSDSEVGDSPAMTFVKERLQIPVRPLNSGQSSSTTWWRRFARLDERSEYVRELNSQPRRGDQPTQRENQEQSEYGLRQFEEQTTSYEPRPEDTAYETTRFHGERPDRCVHLYEMYYADISRTKSGVLNILFEFYSLLFRLMQLGRQSMDFAQASTSRTGIACWIWRVGIFAHQLADICLALVVPFLNLYLLAVASLVVTVWIPSPYYDAIAIGGGALLGIGCAYLCCWYIFPRRIPFVLWLGAPVIAVVAATSLGYFAITYFELSSLNVFAVEWLLVWSMLIAYFAYHYQQRRHGAVFTAIVTWLGACWIVFASFQRQPDATVFGLAVVAALFAEMLIMVLEWVWLALLASACVSPMCVLFSLRYTRSEGGRIARTLFTTLMSITIPTSLFVVATISSFAILDGLTQWGFLQYPTGNYLPWGASREVDLSIYMHQLFIRSGTDFLVASLLFWGIALFLSLWAMAPTLLASFHSRFADRPSERDGMWMEYAYAMIRICILISFAACPLALLLSYVPSMQNIPGEQSLIEFKERTYNTLAMVVAGSAASFLTLASIFQSILTRLWPGVDIVMDVDNLLKTKPSKYTPRARISSRFLSLLEFIAAKEQPPQTYDCVVIVAHSLGTVVTADMLRFLKWKKHPLLKQIGANGSTPLHFVTMGSPLRQLYGWRFPFLYSWAYHRRNKPGSVRVCAAAAGSTEERTHTICEDDTKPHPNTISVSSWTNLYRSGDYVGRFLWRCKKDPFRYTKGVLTQSADGRCREICLGAGGHTHTLLQLGLRVSKAGIGPDHGRLPRESNARRNLVDESRIF